MIAFFSYQRLCSFFLLLVFAFLLMNGCLKFRKRKSSSVSLPREEVSSAPVLPSHSAVDMLIAEGWKRIGDGNLNLAEQKFEKALRMAPTRGEGYLGLAHIAYLRVNYERSLEFLQIGEAYSFQDPELLVRIFILEGDCYRKMGEGEKAQKAYEKALEINQDD